MASPDSLLLSYAPRSLAQGFNMTAGPRTFLLLSRRSSLAGSRDRDAGRTRAWPWGSRLATNFLLAALFVLLLSGCGDEEGAKPKPAEGAGSQVQAGDPDRPFDLALLDGHLYFVDRELHRVRRLGADGRILTVVGTGQRGGDGDGGRATAARLDRPAAVAALADGTLFIADSGNDRVRRVTADGRISTFAGSGEKGFSGDGGPATDARLDKPVDLAVAPDGSVYVVDAGNRRIRRVSHDGRITTVAGTGESGFAGDGGPATAAQLDDPSGVAVGGDGQLYISDTENHRVRRVAVDGLIYTVAGNGSEGLTRHSRDGRVESAAESPEERMLDQGLADKAFVGHPVAVAVDPAENLYIAELANHRVRKVAPDGAIVTVAGTGTQGFGGDGGPAVTASLSGPTSVVAGSDGSVYIADYGNRRVRKVSPDGTITTVVAYVGPSLGVSTERDGEDGTGALVSSVRADSPAFHAGLRPGDFITGLGNQDINGTADLSSAIAQHRTGDVLQLTWRRGQDTHSARVMLAAYEPLSSTEQRGEPPPVPATGR